MYECISVDKRTIHHTILSFVQWKYLLKLYEENSIFRSAARQKRECALAFSTKANGGKWRMLYFCCLRICNLWYWSVNRNTIAAIHTFYKNIYIYTSDILCSIHELKWYLKNTFNILLNVTYMVHNKRFIGGKIIIINFEHLFEFYTNQIRTKNKELSLYKLTIILSFFVTFHKYERKWCVCEYCSTYRILRFLQNYSKVQRFLRILIDIMRPQTAFHCHQFECCNKQNIY